MGDRRVEVPRLFQGVRSCPSTKTFEVLHLKGSSVEEALRSKVSAAGHTFIRLPQVLTLLLDRPKVREGKASQRRSCELCDSSWSVSTSKNTCSECGACAAGRTCSGGYCKASLCEERVERF